MESDMESESDPSDSNCLICISPCKELSTDLFLYNCNCIYVIHKECFIDWRRVSKTNRICIICHEELEPIRGYRQGVINLHIVERNENGNTRCMKFVFIPLFTLGVIVFVVFVIQNILTVILPAFFYKKNSYLLPYKLEL